MWTLKYHNLFFQMLITMNIMLRIISLHYSRHGRFWNLPELCAYQSLKKMRGNNEKRGWVTQVDRAATWHRTEEEKLLMMMIKIFCVKIQRWQSDLVSLRSSKHQSEAGQIKDPTMRSSLMMMIEPKHLIFSHTKIPSLKILRVRS